jgi:hypothetical protein
MPRTGARRLVIDISVARSAGGERATHPTAKNCRDFLQVVLAKHYWVVMSPEILTEWVKYRVPIAITWLAAMRQKDRVYDITPPEFEELHPKIEGCARGEAQLRHMLEDLHLIKAALVTDRTVVSGDREVQHLFARATPDVKELRNIVWVDANDESVVAWAQGGALRTKELHLATLAKNIS